MSEAYDKRKLISRRRLIFAGAGSAALLCSDPVASDAHRPQYHFLPPANWMNDTMGIYWRGEYHIFYLHNPEAASWRQDKHWGHAFSHDLVNWKLLPHALWPVPGGPENLCCQTGSLIADRGTPTAVYTCAPGVCAATSDDDLRTWKRSADNPVIPGPPEGLEVTGFRDPYVWREDDGWYLLMASGTKELGGTVLLYQSQDLRRWEFLHPLLPGEGRNDTVWEVPGLFHLGDRAILLYSPTKESTYTRYFTGSYRQQQFRHDGRGKLDFGGYFYAATTFADASNRRIAIGWLKEGRSREAASRAGWSGCLSLPRVLSLSPTGQVVSEPVPEAEKLRGRHHRFGAMRVTERSTDRPIGGESLEIVAEFEPGNAREFGLKVLCSPDGDEQTLVGYDAAAGQLYIDATRASKSPDAHNRKSAETFEPERSRRLKFRIFVDHSVVEVFVEGVAVTMRSYPTLRESRGVVPYAKGGSANLVSLDAWELRSIW